MTRQSIRVETAKIFKKLQYAKEYRNGFAPAKLRIIMRLLAGKHELRTFAQTPGRRQYEVNGFLMEYCARFSSQLPKNTSKAQYISETIIDHLKKNKLCNPDHIWLRIQGKRITITGIGEVKSHLSSIIHRPGQLFFQETNMRNLIGNHEITSIISKRYRITLADEFARYLVLPRSLNAPHRLPASAPLGWEVKEIELTFPEIIFLKNLLLVDTIQFESQKTISPYYSREDYQLFARDIVKRTEKIIMEFLHNLLPVDQKNVRNALTAWGLLWNSIPANHESVNIAVQWMRAIKQKNTWALSLITTPPLSLTELDEKEKTSRDSIIKCAATNDTILAHALLSRLQEVRQYLPDPPELSKKQDINLFTLL